MKRLLIVLLFLGTLSAFVTDHASAVTTIWARGVNQSGGWFDAEKDSLNTQDDDLCWAASASNILAWSGWDGGFGRNADSIFNFLEAETPIDQGGWQSWAWNFWFTGAQTNGHFAGSTHTGFYSAAEYDAALAQSWDNDAMAIQVAANWLQDDYGVGIAIRDGYYHAITLWGVVKDDADHFIGIWVTDSDDDKGGPDPRPDRITYVPVYFANNLWYLDDYYGEDVAILEMDALKMRHAVPEPSTILLLGAGIFSLGAFRRFLA